VIQEIFGVNKHIKAVTDEFAAQGYLAIALGLAMAAAMAVSGILYGDFGSRAYAAMALVAVAGGVCGFVAHRLRHRAAI